MDTKDLILKISKEEFILKGYNNTSLRDIAIKCHISATAIYRHFKNKEEIFEAVISPFIDHFNQMTEYIEKKDWVLENDNVEAEVVWAYENKGDTTLAGNGYGYNMVCFASDGKYYKYSVNCTDKVQDKNDYTGTKLEEVSVLTENLELYNN